MRTLQLLASFLSILIMIYRSELNVKFSRQARTIVLMWNEFKQTNIATHRTIFELVDYHRGGAPGSKRARIQQLSPLLVSSKAATVMIQSIRQHALERLASKLFNISFFLKIKSPVLFISSCLYLKCRRFSVVYLLYISGTFKNIAVYHI